MCKRNPDPDLIRCTHCGTVLARKAGVTNGIILRCSNSKCNRDLMVTVDEAGKVTVIDVPKKHHPRGNANQKVLAE